MERWVQLKAFCREISWQEAEPEMTVYYFNIRHGRPNLIYGPFIMIDPKITV